MLDGLKVVRWSFPFTKKSRGRQEFLPKRIARPIWRNKQDDNTSQNAQRPSRSFAGKNCTFSLCPYVLMCLLQAPTEEIFYLILSPCLRSQKFFSGLKTSRNKSSTTSPNGITSFFNKSDYLLRPAVRPFLISRPDELLKAHNERSLVSPVHCCSRCFTHTIERFS